MIDSKQHTSVRRRWRNWIKLLEKELEWIIRSTHIYKEIGEIVKNNQSIQKPYDVHNWIKLNYVESTFVAIRKLMDHDKRSISFYHFLKELEANPHIITRASHLSHYSDHNKIIGNKYFDSVAGSGLNKLPKSIPQNDLKQLLTAEKKIRTIVNKRIAHLDRNNLKRKFPSFHEVVDVISLFENTFLKYKQLLTADAGSHMLGTWQYDWKSVFYEPWLRYSKI